MQQKILFAYIGGIVSWVSSIVSNELRMFHKILHQNFNILDLPLILKSFICIRESIVLPTAAGPGCQTVSYSFHPLQLPFIIVNTSKKTVIDCSISNDKMEYLFNFDDTFEIHDDMEVPGEAPPPFHTYIILLLVSYLCRTRESLLKGKIRYIWTPCTKFRSAAFDIT